MRHITDHYGERGYRALALGIGSDDYKRLFCKGDEPIFDSIIPLGPRGRIAAAAIATLSRAKRLVKSNQALFQLAQRLRGALG
jgi:CelD/BcsL family acetyltransferase involved in cellulose biosynthesis